MHKPLHSMVPNSEAVLSGDTIYFGGIVARDNEGRLLFPHDVQRQTEIVIRRIGAYLATQELSLGNLVSVTVFLSDIRYYDAMNETYVKEMPSPLPTRKVIISPFTIEGAMVEFTAIAHVDTPRILSLSKNPT
jgi:2-iminobutanoate/2-iminopropanoate deaminase